MTSTARGEATATPAADRPHVRRGASALLLAVTAAVAVCGLLYELELIALGSYLMGDGLLQTSLVLGSFVSAMGLGSVASKRWLSRPLRTFVTVEATLAVVGGMGAFALYWAFAWMDVYTPVLLGASVLTGALVGIELPLLLELIRRARGTSGGGDAADLLAADYLGAMVAGIAFPFLVLPELGHLRASIATGALNLGAGALVLAVPGLRSGGVRTWLRLVLPIAAAAIVLVGAWLLTGRFEVSLQQELYDDPIVHDEQTRYQRIVVTSADKGKDVRLFLDGDLQFATADEHRYHESLVHPLLAEGRREHVLVLGGGDGLALREILTYSDVQHVTLVELDPRMIHLARTLPALAKANHHSFDDPRVTVVNTDALTWLRRDATLDADAVVVDFPDPDKPVLAKLYSKELYGLVRARALRPGGRMVVQSGSPWFARDAYWSIERTIHAAGFATTPYHVDVPSFGDWGYVLATPGHTPPGLTLDAPGKLRYLSADVLRAAGAFGADVDRRPVKINSIDRPVLVEYERAGWHGY
ncbi:MAG: Spermine synthase [Thermoleophilia bacterium]|nr:Spermine synthase [Thermoleophilia bacterium]